jgi:hypothetical protein
LGLNHFRAKNYLNNLISSKASKILKNRQNPNNLFGKTIFLFVALNILFFPIYWLVEVLLLLGAYIIAWTFFLFTLRRYECIRCINFECSMNTVPENKKTAWRKDA